MTSSLLAKLLKLHEESNLRDRIRTSLVEWASDAMASSGLNPSNHHRLLLANLDLVAKGKIKRLLVLMPPGSAKSTYTSIIFPIWWLMQHPRSSIIAASNTASLVQNFSRRIMSAIDENETKIGFFLSQGDRSTAHWRTNLGGEYFAIGARGAVTGRRADLVIIDDPIKSMAEADSPKHRQHIWDWYSAELLTRLKPDGRVVVVMTRWHEQDLGGLLLARGQDDWHVLRLPALAEADDPLGRPPGAPLWPEWESADALATKRTVVGPRIWSALFQQAPHPPDERLFNIRLLHVNGHPGPTDPSSGRTVRAWDLAATKGGDGNPDWTVGLKLTVSELGKYVVEDVVRFREAFQKVQESIISTAQRDGHSVVISLPIDPGQAGKSQISMLSSSLAGYRIYSSRENGAKISRALAVASQIEAGNFFISPAPWNQTFIDELESFPQGDKDDQVDALSRAFNTLTDLPGNTRRLFVPFNAR